MHLQARHAGFWVSEAMRILLPNSLNASVGNEEARRVLTEHACFDGLNCFTVRDKIGLPTPLRPTSKGSPESGLKPTCPSELIHYKPLVAAVPA